MKFLKKLLLLIILIILVICAIIILNGYKLYVNGVLLKK